MMHEPSIDPSPAQDSSSFARTTTLSQLVKVGRMQSAECVGAKKCNLALGSFT